MKKSSSETTKPVNLYPQHLCGLIVLIHSFPLSVRLFLRLIIWCHMHRICVKVLAKFFKWGDFSANIYQNSVHSYLDRGPRVGIHSMTSLPRVQSCRWGVWSESRIP